MHSHDPLQCVIPPYITEHLAESEDPAIRLRAMKNLAMGAAMRAVRVLTQEMPRLMAAMSPMKRRHRLVYDAKKKDELPGKLARSEGEGKVADKAVNEAYEYSGDTYDFYHEVFERNSLDDNGMTLKSSVHVAEGDGTAMNNAFWNGEQMAYGDGDGTLFQRFTGALDVVGHELTHGVESFTSNLTYQGQSGALNEHFADVFGILVRHWKEGVTAAKASWVLGAEIFVPAPTRRGIRDMEFPGTAYDDPDLGKDPQPDHMSKIYTGSRDRGGVHINSGIPNRAFVLFAQALKGKTWQTAGKVWYDTMLKLTTSSQFADCARISVEVADAEGAAVGKAARAAWKEVGLTV